MTETVGTDLYRRVLAYEHGSAERNRLQREVWEPTPWMVEVYIGRESLNERGLERGILVWCHEEFGDESLPIHRREGTWHRGGATVMGWTWFGFATESLMGRFLARWPQEERK